MWQTSLLKNGQINVTRFGSSIFFVRSFQIEALADFGGVKVPKSELDAITMTIKASTYEVFVAGENHTDKGTRILDETTTPKRITLKSMSGPN